MEKNKSLFHELLPLSLKVFMVAVLAIAFWAVMDMNHVDVARADAGGVTINAIDEFGAAITLAATGDWQVTIQCNGAVQTCVDGDACDSSATADVIDVAVADILGGCNDDGEAITVTSEALGDDGYLKWTSTALTYAIGSQNTINSANQFSVMVTLTDELAAAITGDGDEVCTFDADGTPITGTASSDNTAFGVPVPVGTAVDTITTETLEDQGYADNEVSSVLPPATESGTQTAVNSLNDFTVKVTFLSEQSVSMVGATVVVATADAVTDGGVGDGDGTSDGVIYIAIDTTILAAGPHTVTVSLDGMVDYVDATQTIAAAAQTAYTTSNDYAYKLSSILTEQIGTDVVGTASAVYTGDAQAVNCLYSALEWYCQVPVAHTALAIQVTKDGYVQDITSIAFDTDRTANADAQETASTGTLKYAYKIASIPTENLATELKTTVLALAAGDSQAVDCAQGGDTNWYCAIPLEDTTAALKVTKDGYVQDITSFGILNDRTATTDAQQTTTTGSVKYAYKITSIPTEAVGTNVKATATAVAVGDAQAVSCAKGSDSNWYCATPLVYSTLAIQVTLDGYVQNTNDLAFGTDRTATADAQQTTTSGALLYSHKVVGQDGYASSLTDATVTVGGTSCTEVTGSYYCATPVASDGGTDDVSVAKTGFITWTTDSTNRAANTTAQATYTSANVRASGGGGGGGGTGTIPSSSVSAVINDGDEETLSRVVTLTLTADNAATMLISNDINFLGSEWEPYASEKTWTLTEGFGEKTVYVKFKTSTNNQSATYTDTINYVESVETAEQPAEEDTSEPVTVETPSGLFPGSLAIGDLVKNSTRTTVYYLSADGYRHVFPNDKVYFSWYENFNNVKVISDNDLAQIPLGSNVTMRQGTWLIKIQSVPKVYAVEQGGNIRWVETEGVASALYGSEWNKRVVDIAASFFSNYTEVDSISDNVHPSGSVIRYNGSTNKYYIEDGVKYLISTSAFTSNGFMDKFLIENVSTGITYGTGADMSARSYDSMMDLR
ncbi:MAG TPA: hypothetical protein VMX18_02520 [Candidatus Bipolaricaulota bacterium]|nr:hypothetical protein [Candidatus Bipolaricaulota bacterium]